MTKPINKSGYLEFDYVTDTGLNWPKGRTKCKLLDHVQIHHTVGEYGTPGKWKALHDKKIKEGQKGVPYSYLVLQDGSIYLGRGLECAHGGVKDSLTTNEKGAGANQRSVALAFDGDMRKDHLPTQQQYASAVRLIQDILAYYGDVPILGHNEVPTYSSGKLTGKTYATACPCMDMKAFRSMVKGTATPTPEPDPMDVPQDDPVYPAKYAYTGKTYSNVRSGPGTKYPVTGTISNGEVCTVLDAQADPQYMWYEIQFNGKRGWCTANYLREVG